MSDARNYENAATSDPERWLDAADRADARALEKELAAALLRSRAVQWREIAERLMGEKEEAAMSVRPDKVSP